MEVKYYINRWVNVLVNFLKEFIWDKGSLKRMWEIGLYVVSERRNVKIRLLN